MRDLERLVLEGVTNHRPHEAGELPGICGPIIPARCHYLPEETESDAFFRRSFLRLRGTPLKTPGPWPSRFNDAWPCQTPLLDHQDLNGRGRALRGLNPAVAPWCERKRCPHLTRTQGIRESYQVRACCARPGRGLTKFHTHVHPRRLKSCDQLPNLRDVRANYEHKGASDLGR